MVWPRIRTAILQVLVNLVNFQMPLEDAIAAPRLHLEGERLDMEAGFDAELSERFARSFGDAKIWTEKSLFFGGVHGVGFDSEKQAFWAAGDERRNGCALIVG